MKKGMKKGVLFWGLVLLLLLWGVGSALADGGYCTWSSGVVSLKDGETTGVDFAHLGGCVLKYVLIRPTSASDCSSISAEYKSQTGSKNASAIAYEKTQVCGSASADAEFKFGGSLYYSPVSAKFTCKSATCVFRYGLAWYE